MADDLQKQIADKFQKARQDANVPKIYFNSFANQFGLGDLSIVLQRDDEPIILLTCSFNTAKSLVTMLSELLKKFEDTTGQPVLTGNEIGKKVMEAVQKQAKAPPVKGT
jgi:hypothetical protein